ncbi:hypothetical protein CspHIS471_0302110 [Cutaneotrichosporon sp. HIS471]|nr:hypothetical protein CspHIS471_0302110 [Cutaneotrichosporon sp. HIS471]
MQLPGQPARPPAPQFVQGDYAHRLAPSYSNWQGQAGYNPQMFIPGAGYDVQAAVAAAQHMTPARPPQPARSERFDPTTMPPPGGQYPMGAFPWPRQDVSPTSAREPNGSRPNTSDGQLLSPIQVKSERDEVAPPVPAEEPEPKVDHRKRKRNRTIRSCVPCHNHKRKCDRRRPCGRCTALGLTGSCVYEVDEARDPNDPEVIETDRLRRRIAELEQVVRELRQRHPPRNQAQQQATVNTTNMGSIAGPATADDKRRVIVDRFAKFKLGEVGAGTTWSANTPTGSDASPESTVSLNRPHYAEPYNAASLPGEDLVSDKQGSKTFLGAPAGKPLFRRLREIVVGKGKDHAEIPEDLAFTGWFSTRKTFPFTTIWSHDNFIDEILGLLPSPEDAELLLEAFVDEIAVLFEAWVLPDLCASFSHFFTLSSTEKRSHPLQELSLFIMICSLGCMIRSSASEIFGDGKPSPPHTGRAAGDKDLTTSRLQSELYLSAAYQALRLCSFLSSPTIHTVQSQILINVYLLHSERAADAWALTGSLVRQVIALGLHVDPAHLDPRISQKEAEIRRRVFWTVAGLDCLLGVSFGRPTIINYYTCAVPQDIEDEVLSEEPGSAVALTPPTNALNPNTTEQTFHAAYFQISLPSLELLNRVFHVSPLVARDTFMGWFQPTVADHPVPPPTVVGNTYEDAIRLGRDIFDWYSHVPDGMRFDPEDPGLLNLRQRTRMRINQTLALAVKTFILVLILHRPYLRADPSAYPESSQLCGRSAHIILSAYSAMARTKSSIVWSWWTMSYRAFHAGTVCAFLAIREPGTDLAERCLSDLRSAITIFDDRSSNWNVSHPVQGDLSAGLHRLETLATAATQQHSPRPEHSHHQDAPIFPNFAGDPSVLSFPHELTQASDHELLLGVDERDGVNVHRRPSAPFLQPWTLTQPGPDAGMTSPFTTEPLALPQIWASMFNIKMDPDVDDVHGMPHLMSHPQANTAQ